MRYERRWTGFDSQVLSPKRLAAEGGDRARNPLTTAGGSDDHECDGNAHRFFCRSSSSGKARVFQTRLEGFDSLDPLDTLLRGGVMESPWVPAPYTPRM